MKKYGIFVLVFLFWICLPIFSWCQTATPINKDTKSTKNHSRSRISKKKALRLAQEEFEIMKRWVIPSIERWDQKNAKVEMEGDLYVVHFYPPPHTLAADHIIYVNPMSGAVSAESIYISR